MRPFNSFIFYHFLFCLVCFSQTTLGNLDSLYKQIQLTEDDSSRINLYIEFGYKLEATDFDSALYYYDLGIVEAEKKKLYQLKARALAFKSFAYHFTTFDQEKTLLALAESTELYKQVNDKEKLLLSLFNYGTFLQQYELFDSSNAVYLIALPLAQELGNKLREKNICNNLGLGYQYQGKYDLAIDYFIKVLDLNLGDKDKENFSSYLNIGVSYAAIGNDEEALLYYKKTLDIVDSTKNPEVLALVCKNMGDLYVENNQHNLADPYWLKAIKIFKVLQDSNSIARYYLGKANQQVKLSNWEHAQLNFDTAYASFPKRNGNKRLWGYIQTDYGKFIMLGMSPSKKLDYQKAISTLQDAYATADKINLLSIKASAALALSTCYAARNQFKQAFEYAKIHSQTSDSILSEKAVNRTSELHTKLETERKEFQISLLEKEDEIKTQKIQEAKRVESNQQLIILILVVGVLSISVVLFFLYKFSKQKEKANEELTTKNSIISKQKEEKEVLLKEIHHRVKNNLQIISSLLDLQSRSTKDLVAKAAVNDGQSRVKSMALIHQMLYQHENAGNILFKEYVVKLLNQLSSAHHPSPRVNHEVRIAEELVFDIDTAIPLGLIITELLTNSYKYAFKEIDSPEILIQIDQKTERTYTLTLKDNGKGLPNDLDPKTSKSLGLRLVKTLITQLNGTMNYNNQEGAMFILEFEQILAGKLS